MRNITNCKYEKLEQSINDYLITVDTIGRYVLKLVAANNREVRFKYDFNLMIHDIYNIVRIVGPIVVNGVEITTDKSKANATEELFATIHP